MFGSSARTLTAFIHKTFVVKCFLFRSKRSDFASPAERLRDGFRLQFLRQAVLVVPPAVQKPIEQIITITAALGQRLREPLRLREDSKNSRRSKFT